MRTVLPVVLLASLACPAVAAADDEPTLEEAEAEGACEVSERPHHLGLMAFRIVAGTSRAYPSNSWVFGFGSQLELDVAELFEVALGAAVLLGEESTVFPLDLLVKKTFPVGVRAGFFIGLGPTMAIVTHETQDLEVAFGGTANAGFVLWLEHDLGVVVEATYQLIVEGDPVHDIEGAVGVAWGF